MWEINIYLKNGQIIPVQCGEWNFDTDNQTGEFTGYNFENLVSPNTLEIVPSQISAYTCVKK